MKTPPDIAQRLEQPLIPAREPIPGHLGHNSVEANENFPELTHALRREHQHLHDQIAERPTHRARLELLLLEICTVQAEFVRGIQENRARVNHKYNQARRDNPDLEMELDRTSRELARESATLTRLVRCYRLFNQGADPSDYAHLLRPFLDWASVHEPDHLPALHTLIRGFLMATPWK